MRTVAFASALVACVLARAPIAGSTQSDITATIDVSNDRNALIGSAVLEVINSTGETVTIDAIHSRIAYLAPVRNDPHCLVAPPPDPRDTMPSESTVVLEAGRTGRVGPRLSFDRNCIFPDALGNLRLRAQIRWRYANEPESADRTTTISRMVKLDP